MPTKKLRTDRARRLAFPKGLGGRTQKAAILKKVRGRLGTLDMFIKERRSPGDRISAIYEIAQKSVPETHPMAVEIIERAIKRPKENIRVMQYGVKALIKINHSGAVRPLLWIAENSTKDHERHLRSDAVQGIGALAKVMSRKEMRDAHSKLADIRKKCKLGTEIVSVIDKTLKVLETKK